MFKYVGFYVFCALALMSTAVRSAAECDSYTVVQGDTLRLISERYYGERALSPLIYNENIDVIGSNANLIEIGMELAIPCREGMTLPSATAFLALETPLPNDGADPGTPPFLANGSATPFMGTNGRGIIPGIMVASLLKGGYDEGLDTGTPESAAEILQISSRSENALLSFPWIMPNCETPSKLTAQSRILCDNYTFSDPLFEITLGLFTRPGDPLTNAAFAADFTDKSICIPPFHSEDILLESGISLTQRNITRAPSFVSCLNGLEDGRFDVIVADYQSQQTYSPTLNGQVIDIPAFARQTTLHAIAYNDNQKALAVLKMANAGLQQLMSSGEWFGIVNKNF